MRFNTKVTTMKEFFIESPCDIKELSKVIASIEQGAKLEGVDTSYDDWLTIQSWDDEIKFSYEVKS